jgi:glycosyltransferase involved in cell wall biosynthesis
VTAVLSVVVPAHDEAALIGSMLARILDGDPDELLEVVVVANGCSDDTARVAASVSPRITVVEIDAASKIAALNAGDDAATALPRAYVDADVSVTAGTLFALAAELNRPGGPLVASPRFRVDLGTGNWLVRQHYRVWELSNYRQSGHIGSGVYALSAAGRARFGRFPDVIADDRFVQLLFAEHERMTLPSHEFTVRAPRTLSAQMRRATRIQAGNRQLQGAAVRDGAGRDEAVRDGAVPTGTDHGALVRRVARRPDLWLAFLVYCIGYLVPRLRSARERVTGTGTVAWNRDETSRT